MALRIAIALVAALRAVLVYGEAGKVSDRWIESPRVSWVPPTRPTAPVRRETA
jgi:hypothetical protein